MCPNFGYETQGGSSASIENTIMGAVFTITEDGTADSITAYISIFSGYSDNVKAAIYKHSDLSLIASSAQQVISSTGWKTFPLNNEALTSGTAYILVIWATNANGVCALRYNDGDIDQGHTDYEIYDGFPDPYVPSHTTRKASVYCTYTAGGPPPPAAGGILAQVI